jgi:hypothetical protein
MGRKPPSEIVESIVLSADEAGHRIAQPRLDIGNPGASAIDIRRQYLGPQACRRDIEAVSRDPEVAFGGEAKPLGSIVQALRRRTQKILRIGEPARQPGQVQPALVEEPSEAARETA